VVNVLNDKAFDTIFSYPNCMWLTDGRTLMVEEIKIVSFKNWELAFLQSSVCDLGYNTKPNFHQIHRSSWRTATN